MSKLLIFEDENGKVALAQDEIKVLFLNAQKDVTIGLVGSETREFFPEHKQVDELGKMLDPSKFIKMTDDAGINFYLRKKAITGIVNRNGKPHIVDVDGGGMAISGTFDENVTLLEMAGIANG